MASPLGQDLNDTLGIDDDNVHFELGKILMGLSFSLAVALMIVKVQPRQGDSATNLSSLSYILFNTVLASTILCFAFTMFGMILKKQHLKEAKFCNCIGILLGVLDFFLIVSIFTDDSMVWLVGVVAVVTLLAAAYILRGEMGISLPGVWRSVLSIWESVAVGLVWLRPAIGGVTQSVGPHGDSRSVELRDVVVE